MSHDPDSIIPSIVVRQDIKDTEREIEDLRKQIVERELFVRKLYQILRQRGETH